MQSESDGGSYIYDPEVRYYFGIDSEDMPTALAHIYCDEGFVIAADGRETLRTADGVEIVSETCQKIFKLPGKDRVVACAFIGMVNLRDPAGEVALDFIAECKNAARLIEEASIPEAEILAHRLGEMVGWPLAAVKQRIGSYPSPEPANVGERGHTMLRVYFDGYFAGLPFRDSLRFFHDRQAPGWGTAHHDLHPRHRNVMRGSHVIAQLLFGTEDPRLAQYRTEASRIVGRQHQEELPLSLDQAMEVAGNYVRACSDPIALEIDRENCQWIGGHIHMATITPERGFEWVIPPASSE